MEQYCIYLRKSQKDTEAEQRGEGETLARHEKALVELSKKQKLSVTHIYREIVSGDSIEARPEMKELLKAVEQGVWTGVLVMEVERLARGDTKDQGIVAQAFKYSETLIVTPSKTYDPSNEFDEEYFEFGLFMSRRELKTITRRLQRGRLASVKEGKYVGSRDMYGYVRKKLVGQKGWTLEQVPDQAETVRTIFELYTVGEPQPDGSRQRLGTGLIARRLNELKISPLRGDYWTAHSLRDMLENVHYVGMVKWNTRPTVKKMVDGQIKLSNPRAPVDTHEIHKGLHEAIIDDETYAKAQELMKKDPTRPVNDRSVVKNPLASILTCGKCGRTMARRGPSARSKDKSPESIYCYLPECTNVGAHLENVENRILEALEEWLADYRLKWSDGTTEKDNSAQSDLRHKALKKLEEELAALNKQKGNIHDMLERGLYDTETFLERSRNVGERIQQTQDDYKALLSGMQAQEEQEAARTLIIPKVENVLAVYRTLPDAQAKNDLLKEILDKVVYVKEKSTRWNDTSDAFELTLYPKLPMSLAQRTN